MKCITLWQPWASLIAALLKHYETRHWPTTYRGKLAIHAAKRPIVDEEVEAIYNAVRRRSDDPQIIEQLDKVLGSCFTTGETLPLGSIVAIADLTACLQMVETEALYGWKNLRDSQIFAAPTCKTKEQLFEATGFGSVRVDEPIKGMIAVPVQWFGGRLQEVIPISKQSTLEKATGLWQPKRYAWRLENVMALTETIPTKGAQGLWTPSPELLSKLTSLTA